MLVVLFFIGVPTSPASGGFSHENINRGQNLQCTAALLNTVHAKLYPGHTVIRSPFCRWIERSDVHWEWTNVVRAWIESWMPLAWGLVSAAALCCLALKKATLCSFFFFFFRAAFPLPRLCVLFQFDCSHLVSGLPVSQAFYKTTYTISWKRLVSFNNHQWYSCLLNSLRLRCYSYNNYIKE